MNGMKKINVKEVTKMSKIGRPDLYYNWSRGVKLHGGNVAPAC
jgi:hypothetical protein